MRVFKKGRLDNFEGLLKTVDVFENLSLGIRSFRSKNWPKTHWNTLSSLI
jgi:hypothetical protein